MISSLIEGGEAAGVQAEDAGAAGRARRGSAAHQEQPDRGAQGIPEWG